MQELHIRIIVNTLLRQHTKTSLVLHLFVENIIKNCMSIKHDYYNHQNTNKLHVLAHRFVLTLIIYLLFLLLINRTSCCNGYSLFYF